MTCGILIPAYNEETTLATVVKAALASQLGTVLVIDDGSEDATAKVAKRAGASVLSLPENLGKGGAVAKGAKALDTEVVVLLDADLTGLTPEHIKQLAQPVFTGKVDMTRGVFKGGRWRTTAAQHLAPRLNGQRAMLREKLLEIEGLVQSRYGIEIAITEHAKRENWRSLDVDLTGVSQVMKEEKRGFMKGLAIRLGMYRDIVKTWLQLKKTPKQTSKREKLS